MQRFCGSYHPELREASDSFHSPPGTSTPSFFRSFPSPMGRMKGPVALWPLLALMLVLMVSHTGAGASSDGVTEGATGHQRVVQSRGRILQETVNNGNAAGPNKEAVVGVIPTLLQGGWGQINFTKWTEKVYCDGDWSSENAVSKFVKGPCVAVSGIGIIGTPYKTVYIIDRTDHINTYLKMPNGLYAYAEELNLATGAQRPLDVRTNTFCSSGQYRPDGSFISIGGYPKSLDTPGYTQGLFSIRRIMPAGNFQVVARMTSARWYPTTQTLADGRVLIVGGSIEGGGVLPAALNNPTLEYYPRRTGEGNYPVPVLSAAIPYALYPFVHLLPSGRVFIFAANLYCIFDTVTNRQVGPSRYYPGSRTVVFSYPLSGTSFMYPLRAENGYMPEIMVCGGGEKSTKPADGMINGKVLAPAYQWCHTVIDPESRQPVWLNHLMTYPRVGPNAVLLADGSAMIMGGAETGFVGIPVFVSKPVYTPERFDTRKHAFTREVMATSTVPRLYHSSSMLLHDATVMLSGSNPNIGIKTNNGIGTTQFKVEYFYPPYLLGGRNPSIIWAPKYIRTGSLPFTISVNCFDCPKVNVMRRVKVTLAYPGFSTHSYNHGMRNVDLQIVRIKGLGPLSITVKTPPNKNIAPPTYYWLFVLIDGKPNRDGHAIWIK